MPESISPSNPLRVLLIDDNPDDRALVERELRLRIEAVEVRHISDAAGLSEALEAGGFDVAVTDYRLRWTIGTEVLREIKGRYPSAPVIMFTGSGNEEVAVDAMKEGLDDYITKTPKHYPRVPFAVLACFERVNNRARLQASVARESLAKARLEVALQSAGMATWQVDLASGQLSCSDDAGPMFGHPPGFVHAAPAEALAQVHPEDLAGLQALWRTVLDGTSRVTAEFRVLGADGELRWIAGSAKLLQHDGSRAALVIGTLRDVTAELMAKEAQRKQQEELQTILDVLPVGIAISRDPEARHIEITPAFSALLGIDHGAGYDRVGTQERPYRYLRAGQAIEPEDWPMRVAARRGEAVRGDELDVQFNDGRTLTILVNAAPLFDAQARVRGVVAAIVDISALKGVQHELEKANRQKTEFLSVLAHELRNPMAAIGYSVEMLRQVGSPAAIGRARDVIARQTRHMGRLLDDLLDLSRITLNRIELDRRPVDLRRTIELAYESTRALIESLGHDIRFDLPALPVIVEGDEVRLTQIVSNLLNNAAKFTPGPGAIAVRAAIEGEWAVVTIADNGAGIAQDQLESVFEMFSQGQSKVSGGPEGLGIGLAVVRKLVELHGGRVEALSEGAERGTTIRMELPCMAAGAMAEQDDARLVPASGAQARLLVADDNIDAADLLADVLRMEGYAVQVAYDGREAIRMADQWRPDALVLDIGMPHANGLEVARWVRAQEWGRKAALIAVTGWGQQHDRSATVEAGFDEHLVKPVSPQEIVGALGRHMGS
ncbi:response regulator [Massilia sp. 9I]|uniref:hybrid sensor histidine kinase/response regulator n=1 Tax=Massilia sp. 9I TaxID=2653152 RepID=UPI0012EFE940|nr:response regulator [Massilia sp. 9I]VXC44357.1 PAS domain S-box protein [Massilia sp. 9I]